MNERIRELADQVMKDAKGSLNFEQFYEKFAELIVKECVEVACKYDEPKLSGPGLMIGHMIEAHFGVEE